LFFDAAPFERNRSSSPQTVSSKGLCCQRIACLAVAQLELLDPSLDGAQRWRGDELLLELSQTRVWSSTDSRRGV